MNTSDGRYQLEPDVTGGMNGTLLKLLTLGDGVIQADPLDYWTEIGPGYGGLTNIASGVNGILLGNTLLTKGNGQTLYLLDASGYNGGSDPNAQYLQINGNQVTLADVNSDAIFNFTNGGPTDLKKATFLTVYYDTDIAASTSIGTNSPNVAGAYYPITSSALAKGFPVSLSTGDVLDLSHLYDPVNATIRICGDATIIGGGPSGSISGLTIEIYGGTLTVSNLFLTSSTNIINIVNGALTLVAQGSNSLSTSAGAAVVSASWVNITFTGPGSLAVTTADANAQAVQTLGDIIATGANLTFSSPGSSSLAAYQIYILNSVVTSHVGVESDNEFATTIPTTLGNSVLNMSYGTIDPYIISPCTWLGQIRGRATFSVQQTHSSSLLDFHDGIYVKLVGTTGTSEVMNINSAPNHSIANDGTALFNMSYSITNTAFNNRFSCKRYDIMSNLFFSFKKWH